MEIASLELSRELYELSGWDTNLYQIEQGGKIHLTLKSDIPAYDLGYLLRKLPNGVTVMYNSERSAASYQVPIGEVLLYGDTPEDAACKLAIELWKQDILKGEI